jgi:hypothetical protein
MERNARRWAREKMNMLPLEESVLIKNENNIKNLPNRPLMLVFVSATESTVAIRE